MWHRHFAAVPLMAPLYGPAVRCKLDMMIWRWLVLRFCIRPLNGALLLLAIMDIRAHPISCWRRIGSRTSGGDNRSDPVMRRTAIPFVAAARLSKVILCMRLLPFGGRECLLEFFGRSMHDWRPYSLTVESARVELSRNLDRGALKNRRGRRA
jgi:hypothetical protein